MQMRKRQLPNLDNQLIDSIREINVSPSKTAHIEKIPYAILSNDKDFYRKYRKKWEIGEEKKMETVRIRKSRWSRSVKFLWEFFLRSWEESLNCNARKCPQSANLIGETWRKVFWSARIKPDESKERDRKGQSAPLREIYKPKRHKLPRERWRKAVSRPCSLSSSSPLVIRRKIYRNRFAAGGGHDRDIGLPRQAIHVQKVSEME